MLSEISSGTMTKDKLLEKKNGETLLLYVVHLFLGMLFFRLFALDLRNHSTLTLLFYITIRDCSCCRPRARVPFSSKIQRFFHLCISFVVSFLSVPYVVRAFYGFAQFRNKRLRDNFTLTDRIRHLIFNCSRSSSSATSVQLSTQRNGSQLIESGWNESQFVTRARFNYNCIQIEHR